MLKKCDLDLLKTILAETNAFSVDCRYFTMRKPHYDKMKYMVDVIKCDPANSRYQVLNIAANADGIK